MTFDISISPVDTEEIPQVALLEHIIEGSAPVGPYGLCQWREVFPEGFIVARLHSGVLGYLQSCRWSLDDQQLSERFVSSNRKSFSEFHEPNGDNLYVLFVGVNPYFRKKGVGSALVEGIKDYAVKNGVKKIQLVAAPGRAKMYGRLGFKELWNLRGITSNIECTLMSCDVSKQ